MIMKIKNMRVISFVVLFSILFSVFNVVGAKNEMVNEETLYERCNEQYYLLTKLGVINNDFKADALITRGEFASVVSRFIGIPTGETAEFLDVSEETPNSKAIGVLSKAGIMTGYPTENKFYPEQPITQMQAVSVLLRAVGYKEIAEFDGGYPTGYLLQATNNKMLTDCGIDENLTWEYATKLVYNTLFVKMPDYALLNKTEKIYTISETEIIEGIFKLNKARGIIVADRYVALGTREKCSEGFVVIKTDDNDYLLEDNDGITTDRVGEKIIYYYDSEGVLVAFISDEDNERNSISITQENFSSVNELLTEIIYYEEGYTKQKTAVISKYADMVYNGVEFYGVTKKDFENADYIKLFDYNKDGAYDIVYIEEFEVRMVDKVVTETKMISDKRSGISPLILDDPGYDLSVLIDDEEVDFNLISEWDTVCVAISKNEGRKRLSVHICSDLVTGNVTLINKDLRTVNVDGMDFYVSRKMKDYNKIRTGRDVIMGLNPYGAVVCFDYTTEQAKQYGYALGLDYDEIFGTSSGKLRIISADGEIVVLEFADKVYLNGHKDNVKSISNALGYSKSNIVHQLVAYELNDTGKIHKFYTADKTKPKGAVEPTDPQNPNELICNEFLNKKYATVQGYLNTQYLYTSSSDCFVIITDDEGKVIEEVSGMFIAGEEAYYNGRAQNVYVYDSGESCIAGAIVIQFSHDEASTYLPYENFAFVVEEVSKAIDNNGNYTYAVSGYHETAYVTFYPEENVDVSGWKCGDTFMIGLSRNKKLIYARKMFGLYDDSDLVLSRTNYQNGEYTSSKPAMRIFSTDDASASATTAYLQSRLSSYGILKEVTTAGNFNVIRIHAMGCDKNSYNVYTYDKASPLYLFNTQRETLTLLDTSNLAIGLEGEVNLFVYNGMIRHIMIIQ